MSPSTANPEISAVLDHPERVDPDPGVVIRFRDVSVWYRKERTRTPSMKEWFGKLTERKLQYEHVRALEGIDLDIERGQRLGVIGRNGSGKTTLLRVIAGVLIPTRGTVTVAGDVAPLLSIGIGFNPELTGRENIFLGGLLRGRSRREVRARFDEIVDASGLGDFIDSPIRTYSAGMRSRLAFSVATAWSADIVLLDEVLAVGDAEMRQRSAKRLSELTSGGTTVVTVSHDLGAIRSSCDRCLWLDRGRLVADGPSEPVIAKYEAAAKASQSS